MEDEDEEKVERDIHDRRDDEEEERDDRVSHGAQEGGAVVVEEDGDDAGKDPEEIVTEVGDDFLGDLYEADDFF